jgi:hypothetical protein
MVACAAYEQFGLLATMEEIEVVTAVIQRGHGQAKPDDCFHSGVGTHGSQSHCRAKGESSKNHRETKLTIEPFKRRANIIHFAHTMIVLTLTQPSAAEVEAQHRKSEVIQRLHRVKHDFVVQCPAVDRMGMADQRGVGCILAARIE